MRNEKYHFFCYPYCSRRKEKVKVMKCRKCRKALPDEALYCMFCGTPTAKPKLDVPEPKQLPSGSWRIQLMIEGERFSITAPTEKECIKKAIAAKEQTPPKEQRVTVGELIDSYIKNKEPFLSPSTIRGYKLYRNNYLQGIMNIPVGKLTVESVQGAINDDMDKSPKTILNAFMLFKSAVKDKTNIDLSAVQLPKQNPKPPTTLTPGEIKILIKGIKGNPCELEILLALWLGLRRSEILALQKSCFNFEHKTVTISAAAVRNADNQFVTKSTKTTSSVRVLSCPDYILDMVDGLPEGALFQYSENYILKQLHKVCKDNGLPQIRLHDLRHINASIMLMLNTPDKYAMERGGWASKKTMTGRYQHTYDEERMRVDETINSFFDNLTV